MGRKQKSLPVVNAFAAGIDVGASCHYVCASTGGTTVIRRFGTFTEDLIALTQWLLSLGVKTVAMESTGVYWVNLYDTLEASGIAVCLANARYVKNVPGRKSDVGDAEWIWQLHSFGLLSGSFIANEKIREMRTYVRQRENLEGQKATQINLIGKALQLLNVKLRQAISKIDTQVGMNIVRAIVSGERDCQQLARFHHPQMKQSKETLAKSLEGNWKTEHLFTLKQSLSAFDFIKEQMRECEVQIERCLDQMNGGDGGSSLKKKGVVRQNDLAFHAKKYLDQITGIDLCAIDGLDEKTVVTIISETGSDLSKWQTAKHFCSWLGLAPAPKKSGEKVIGHFQRSVAGRAAKAFRAAAASLHHSKSHLGAFYRKTAIHKSSLVAIKATARKIAVIFWNILTKQTGYISQTADTYEDKYRKLNLKRLERQAAKLGFQLQAMPQAFDGQ